MQCACRINNDIRESGEPLPFIDCIHDINLLFRTCQSYQFLPDDAHP